VVREAVRSAVETSAVREAAVRAAVETKAVREAVREAAVRAASPVLEAEPGSGSSTQGKAAAPA